MRIVLGVAAWLAVAAAAHAQPTDLPTAPLPREGFAFGISLSPALEGSGPWFLPGYRLTAPLGAKAALDLDAGIILGGSGMYTGIHGFYASKVRFARKPRRPAGSTSYWLTGLTFLQGTKIDSAGNPIGNRTYNALTIGHGWNEVFRNGGRITGEVGFSGGEGYMLHATLAVQFGERPPNARKDLTQ